MDFNLNKVRFSYKDREKQIKIPKYLTPGLAEDIGIHIGDGSLYKCNSKRTTFEFSYASNIHEKDYLNYIIKLKKKLYNLKKFKLYQKSNEINLRFNSLAIATFYTNVVKIPAKSKVYTARIPKLIIDSKNKEIIASFLRGIVDTDFYFCFKNKYGKLYPTLQGSFASVELVKDLKTAFDFLGIKNNIKLLQSCPDKRFNKSWLSNIIIISGRERVGKYLKLSGFSNHKNIERVKKWA